MRKAVLIFVSLIAACSIAGCNVTIETQGKDESEVVSSVSSEIVSDLGSDESSEIESKIESEIESNVTSDVTTSVPSDDSDVSSSVTDWDQLFKNIQSTNEFVDSLNSKLNVSSSSASSSSVSSDVSSSASSRLSGSSSKITATDAQLKSMVEEYLSNKYVGNWHADSVINRAYMDDSHALISAYKSGANFRFAVVAKFDGSMYYMIDNYVECNAKDSVSTMFRNQLSGKSVDSAVCADFGYKDLESSINVFGENNSFLDSHGFIEKWDVDSFYIQVFVCDSMWTDSSLDKIVTVAENVSHSYDGIKMAVGIHFVDDLTSVKSSLNKEIAVGDDYLNSHGKQRDSIVFGVRNGARDDSCIDEILN